MRSAFVCELTRFGLRSQSQVRDGRSTSIVSVPVARHGSVASDQKLMGFAGSRHENQRRFVFRDFEHRYPREGCDGHPGLRTVKVNVALRGSPGPADLALARLQSFI
jgi:hypothetical protein